MEGEPILRIEKHLLTGETTVEFAGLSATARNQVDAVEALIDLLTADQRAIVEKVFPDLAG